MKRLNSPQKASAAARLGFILCSLFALASATFAQQGANHPARPANAPKVSSVVVKGAAQSAQAPAAPRSLSNTSWTAIGPAALFDGTANVSGRITGIATDPTDATTIYFTAAGGGVWKTSNSGTTWAPLTDGQSTLAMGAIAIAPSSHLKIYAGTGEANNSADSDFGLGILISNDGGVNWTLSTGPGAIFSTKRFSIAQISVNPTDPNTAYAAVSLPGENGTFSANGGTGIYKTSDGGTTWTNTTTGISEVTLDGTFNSTFSWSAVVVDPNTPATIYATHSYTSNFHNYNSANGVYRSTNSGTSWSLLAGPPNGNTNANTGRISLAVGPSANVLGAHVLYVTASNISTGGLLYFGRSNTADAAVPAFTDLTAGTPDFMGAGNGSGQGWYDQAIIVDPTNSQNVYCAGVVTYSTNTKAVIKSVNGGSTWTDITTVGGVEPHTDHHALAFDAGGKMLDGNDGGIWRYDPVGNTWTNLNNGINTIQLTGIGLHPTSTATVIGGSQDNGTELYSNNIVWTETDGGDGGYSLFSQTNPLIVYGNHPIGSFGTTAFFRVSTNGGTSWVARTPTISNSNLFNFYAPIAVDPLNGNRVFLGGDALYESTNAGTSWTTHASPAPTTAIDSIAVVPGSNTLYVAAGGAFASTSTLWKSVNDGSTWSAINLPVTGRVQELDVDPNDGTGATVVAVINMFNAANGQVYRTTNGGTTWTNISANIPQVPAWSAKIDTDSNKTIYVSNETAVYSSPSPYTTWTAFGTGLPHVQGVSLQLNLSLHLLAVGTHGRGAWEINTPAPVPTVTLNTANLAQNAPTITIAGTNFSTTPANNSVAFNLGAIGTVTAATTTQLTVTFSTLPTATGSLTANVTVFGGSSGATQVATIVSAPAVTTPTSASITASSATLGGNVTSDGGVVITERGVVYSVTSVNNNPLIGGASVTKVTSAGTTGVFTINASALTAGTGYSFKAYAINSVGTTYTTPVSTFTTLTAPTVTTPTQTAITANSATLGGNVTSDGGSAITERGVVYSVTSVDRKSVV